MALQWIGMRLLRRADRFDGILLVGFVGKVAFMLRDQVVVRANACQPQPWRPKYIMARVP